MSHISYRGLVFNVLPKAQIIEKSLEKFLMPYQTGLYLSAEEKPVICADKKYYYFQYVAGGVDRENPIALTPQDWATLVEKKPLGTGDIWCDGEIVYRQNSNRLLSLQPTVAFRALQLIKHYLEWTCDKLTQRVQGRTQPLDKRIEFLLKPEYRDTRQVEIDLDESDAGLFQKVINLSDPTPLNYARITHPTMGWLDVPVQSLHRRVQEPLLQGFMEILSEFLEEERETLTQFVQMDLSSFYYFKIEKNHAIFVYNEGELKIEVKKDSERREIHRQPIPVPESVEINRMISIQCFRDSRYRHMTGVQPVNVAREHPLLRTYKNPLPPGVRPKVTADDIFAEFDRVRDELKELSDFNSRAF